MRKKLELLWSMCGGKASFKNCCLLKMVNGICSASLDKLDYILQMLREKQLTLRLRGFIDEIKMTIQNWNPTLLW